MTPNFVARGDIAPSVFVKQDAATDNGVLQADSGSQPIGISSEAGYEPPLPSVSTIYAGRTGIPMRVYGNTDTCLLLIGSGGCAAGDKLKPDTNGAGVTASSSGNLYGAKALRAAAEGEYVEVQVQIGVVP